MAVYKSAMGKKVDMTALMAKNEKVRAVSNAKLNANGDVIDSKGNVIKTANNRVNENYAKTVGNRSANVVKKVPRVGDDPIKQQLQPKQELEEFQLTEAEKELEQELSEEVEVEKPKTKEVSHGTKANVRRTQN